MINFIQNMPQQKSDSFAYIATTPERSRWSVAVWGCGFARTAPQHPYPAPGHPPDHDFDFENGRFRRIFRKQTGISPWQYLLRSRLAHARRLLDSSDETLASIAETVGFGSAFHFSSSFKKAYGVSPDNWRKKHNPSSRLGGNTTARK